MNKLARRVVGESLRLVIYASIAYGAALVWIRSSEPSMVFPAANLARPIPRPELPAGTRDVAVDTADGLTLSMQELATPGATRWVILFPGQWGLQTWNLPMIRLLHEQSCSILIVNYRGYDGNPGTATEAGLYQDADAAWNHLTEQGVPPDRIFIYGHSLGAAVAIDLASRKPAAALITDGAFDSVVSCGAARYPWLPVSRISRCRFASVEKVPEIRYPKLFLHGLYDETIPVSHGRALFAAAAEPKQWVGLRGRHEDFQWSDEAAWREAVTRFLEDLQ